VPVRTLNAGPNPRYFGPGRGVTYLNFLSDQFTGFHAVVVPGTGAAPSYPAPSSTAVANTVADSSRLGASSSINCTRVPPIDIPTMDVPASVAWTDSGLSLKAAQPFAVHAAGQVSFSLNGPLVGPNGASDLHPGVCVLPGATRHAGLIGRIGATAAGPAFFVGEDFTGVADRAGELFLGINDTGVDNNSGSFHVSVQA